jgi:hypothetical protein
VARYSKPDSTAVVGGLGWSGHGQRVPVGHLLHVGAEQLVT